jgi:hypothetical protein
MSRIERISGWVRGEEPNHVVKRPRCGRALMVVGEGKAIEGVERVRCEGVLPATAATISERVP